MSKELKFEKPKRKPRRRRTPVSKKMGDHFIHKLSAEKTEETKKYKELDELLKEGSNEET